MMYCIKELQVYTCASMAYYIKNYVEGQSMMDDVFLNGIYYMPRHLEADFILLQLKHDVFLNGM